MSRMVLDIQVLATTRPQQFVVEDVQPETLDIRPGSWGTGNLVQVSAAGDTSPRAWYAYLLLGLRFENGEDPA